MRPSPQDDPRTTAPLLVTRAEAARRLGLDRVARNPERTVREMVARGDLRGVAVGRWLMIEAASIERWVARR